LLGGTGGGRYASTDRVCRHSPQPLLVGISGVLKNEPSAAAPRDPQPYHMDWDGLLRVPNAMGMIHRARSSFMVVAIPSASIPSLSK
jgi:hypothetical protein